MLLGERCKERKEGDRLLREKEKKRGRHFPTVFSLPIFSREGQKRGKKKGSRPGNPKRKGEGRRVVSFNLISHRFTLFLRTRQEEKKKRKEKMRAYVRNPPREKKKGGKGERPSMSSRSPPCLYYYLTRNHIWDERGSDMYQKKKKGRAEALHHFSTYLLVGD